MCGIVNNSDCPIIMANTAIPKTESGIRAEEALRGTQIKDGIFWLAPGEVIFVKIAYVNDSDQTVRFRAIPHHIEPQNLQIVAIFQCMCLGETYSFPPSDLLNTTETPGSGDEDRSHCASPCQSCGLRESDIRTSPRPRPGALGAHKVLLGQGQRALPPAFASRGASAKGLSRPIALALKTYLVLTSPEDKCATQL